MKRKVKMTLTILISMTLIFVVYKMLNPKEKNIFDEMYYGEKKIDSWGDNTPFAKIKGIENWNRKRREDTWRGNGSIIFERYKDKYTSKKLGEWEILFSFDFEEKGIDVNFGNEINKEKINIIIYNEYSTEKKVLYEKIAIFDRTLQKDKAGIEEIPKIKEYLKRSGISIKDLKETADELMYEKLIGDWEKYTDSKYSKENIGTVKIERSPLFENID